MPKANSGKIEALLTKHGNNLMVMGSTKIEKIPVIPTSSYFLNDALGVGGLPLGKSVEIYGAESCGKTTLGTDVCINAQNLNKDKMVLYLDVEHAFDRQYAKNMGLDLNRALISQPDSGEEALDILEDVIRSGEINVAIIDSVAGLTSAEEIEKSAGEDTMGKLAKLTSKIWRKLKAPASKTNTLVFFINQLRAKSSGLFRWTMAPTGGEALKYGTTVRLHMKKEDIITKSGSAIAQIVNVKVVKNKVAPPFREAKFYIQFGKGIARTWDEFDIATQMGLINKSGTWYKIGDETLSQGYLPSIEAFEQREDYNELRKQIVEYYETELKTRYESE